MLEKEYGIEDLARARELQQEAIKLHLPCPPVVHWNATIVDENGIVEERRKGKCNSYTRNGLNLIATAGMCLPTYVRSNTIGDGLINIKTIDGIIYSGYWPVYYSSSSDLPKIIYGNGTDAESLDSYQLSSEITSGTQNTTQGAYFDADTRKLINVLSGTLQNTTTADLSVTETGVACIVGRSGTAASTFSVLVVRDLLAEAITVPAGKTLNFNYTFEMAYPEP